MPQALSHDHLRLWVIRTTIEATRVAGSQMFSASSAIIPLFTGESRQAISLGTMVPVMARRSARCGKAARSRPRKTPPLGEGCDGVPGPLIPRQPWGRWGDASSGPAFLFEACA